MLDYKSAPAYKCILLKLEFGTVVHTVLGG